MFSCWNICKNLWERLRPQYVPILMYPPLHLPSRLMVWVWLWRPGGPVGRKLMRTHQLLTSDIRKSVSPDSLILKKHNKDTFWSAIQYEIQIGWNEHIFWKIQTGWLILSRWMIYSFLGGELLNMLVTEYLDNVDWHGKTCPLWVTLFQRMGFWPE